MNTLTRNIFSYIVSSWCRAGLLLLVISVLGVSQAEAQTTYYWRGTAGDSWNSATNWNTALNGTGTTRGTAQTTDILIFDGTAGTGAVFPNPIIVDFGGGANNTSQTIAQLRFVNNANVTLAGPTTANKPSLLNIAGGATASAQSDDFFVQAGSRLAVSFSGNTDNRFLLLQIGSTRKGLVAGSITFNTAATITTRLVALSAGGLVFANGGVFTATSLLGSPFGTTGINTLPTGFSEVSVADAVTFNDGATFVQQGGVHPFSAGATAVTKFLSGSMYTYSGGIFSDIGRTYGNLQFLTTPVTVAGASNLTIFNNLTVGDAPATALTAPIAVNLNVVGTGPTGGTAIGGNVVVYRGGGNSLTFAPSSQSATTSRVILNGSIPQFIGAAAGVLNAPVFGANTGLEIRNTSAAGITLLQPISLVRGILFNAGLLNTTTTNILTLPATALVVAATGTTNSTVSNSSYVNGPLVRTTTAAGTSTPDVPNGTGLFFPIGKGGSYRPISLALNQTSTGTGSYTSEVIAGPAPSQTFPASSPSSIKRVSQVRHYAVSSPATFNAGQITIYYGTNDAVDNTSLLRIAKSQGGTWTNLGGGTPGSASASFLTGSITSATAADATNAPNAPFTSLGNFALASTVAAVTAGNNPLPVELTQFTATAKGQGINLNWTTASEKNSSHFDVQRSSTGTTFQTIGKVQSHGNSSTTQVYATLDRSPLAGVAYYRLQQVDVDGVVAYSPIVTVRWAGATQVYPNPSTGTLYLLNGTTGPVAYRILTAQGKTLLAGEVVSETGIDVRQLPAGIYLLETATSQGPRVQRFVRQ